MNFVLALTLLIGQAPGADPGAARIEDRLRLAAEASGRGADDRAILLYTEIIGMTSDASALRAAHLGRAMCRDRLGDLPMALRDYRAAVDVAPDSPTAHNGLAWFLATCPQAGFRDGAEAYEHARNACDLTGWKDASCFDTLAAAYAESGDFVEAVRWQRRALAAIDARYRAEAAGRLRLYEQDRPYRRGMPLPRANVVATPTPSRSASQSDRVDAFIETMKTIQDVAGAVQDARDVARTVREVMPAAAVRRSALVVVRSVAVARDDHGKAWDASGPPDLKVRVEQSGFLGDSATTDTRQDVYSATFDAGTIRVSEGDTIKITVLDGDVFVDDTIGTTEVPVTSALLDKGSVNWTFGGVTSLVLEFRP